jgi:hypothetical protein
MLARAEREEENMPTKEGPTPRELILHLVEADMKVCELLKQHIISEPKDTQQSEADQAFAQAVIDRELTRSAIRSRYQ